MGFWQLGVAPIALCRSRCSRLRIGVQRLHSGLICGNSSQSPLFKPAKRREVLCLPLVCGVRFEDRKTLGKALPASTKNRPRGGLAGLPKKNVPNLHDSIDLFVPNGEPSAPGYCRFARTALTSVRSAIPAVRPPFCDCRRPPDILFETLAFSAGSNPSRLPEKRASLTYSPNVESITCGACFRPKVGLFQQPG